MTEKGQVIDKAEKPEALMDGSNGRSEQASKLAH